MQRRPLMGVASRGERDEELALFHEMHKKEDGRKSNAVHPLNCESAIEREPRFIMTVKSVGSSTPEVRRRPSSAAASMAALNSSRAGDDLLTADLGKNDYDWLLTPPGTPLVNPPDHISSAYGDDFLSHAVLPNLVRSLAAIKTSRLSSLKSEPIMRKEASNGALLSMRPDPAMRSVRNGLHRSASSVAGAPSFMTNNAASMASRRTPLAPGSRPSSRPTTPTKRPVSSSTPVSRPTTPTNRTKVASTPVSRPTTPTSRSRAAPTPLSRPSTPSSRPTIASASRNGDSNIVSSSMTTRGSVPSRPTTPLRRPAAVAQTQTQAVSAVASRSSSVTKGRPAPSRSTPSSRGSSPVIKPNAWQQLSDIPGFSLEPPPNLRTSLPVRPSSNSRGASVSGTRPGSSSGVTMAMTARAVAPADMQLERPPDVSTRRAASPSLARGRSGGVPSSTVERQSSVSTLTVRNGKFDKSPGAGEMSVKGAKVVDRMVLPRRPFPSSLSPETALSMSQIKHVARPGTPTASKDNSGFGRCTPRKSMELPTRHMELRQSSSNGLRSLMRNTPTSSLYSVRPAGMRVLANSSPMATSSNASSDYSMSMLRDPESSEQGEELISEAGSKASPASQSDSLSSLLKNAHMNNWLGSPEYKDGTPDYKDGTPEYKNGTPESFQEGTPESNLVVPQMPESNLVIPQMPESHLVIPQTIEKPVGSDAGVLCRHGCVAANCDLCNMKIRLQKLNEKCRASLRASLHTSEAQKDSLSNGGS